jgi:transcriptional regulator with XRE-family HTH domain
MVYHGLVDFGAFLRDVRRRHGLDQATLARRAATTQTYISRIERGEVSPSARTMQRLLAAMGEQLAFRAQPLSPGNVSVDELRADYRELTAAERVEQAMELSDFLAGVAAEARDGTR